MAQMGLGVGSARLAQANTRLDLLSGRGKRRDDVIRAGSHASEAVIAARAFILFMCLIFDSGEVYVL